MKGESFKSLIWGAFFLLVVCAPGNAAEQPRTTTAILSSMSLDDKIAQLMMLGFNGTKMSEPFRQYISKRAVGGFILFRHNLHTGKESTRKLTGDIQRIMKAQSSHLPALIAVDLEGGVLKRFPEEVLSFPSARQLGTIDDRSEVERICAQAARKIHSMGINMNLAPVLEPCGPVMKTRVFDCSVEKVMETGSLFIRGFQMNGVIATAKHFPGNAGVDPHNRLGKMEGNLSDLERTIFPSFRRAIQEGVGAMMVSHVYLSNVDAEEPSSLSKKVIGGVLRERLGFDGVVLTDDLLCAGSQGRVLESLFSVPESGIRAILAGADMIMLSDAGFAPAVHSAIREAVVTHRISERQVDVSVGRILTLKERFNVN
jgi:beta-N-acetylhexosaminidase